MDHRINLTRKVNGRTRYYQITTYQTLFGGYEVSRVFGATINKKPTGIVRDFFDSIEFAKLHVNSLVNSKKIRGYANI